MLNDKNQSYLHDVLKIKIFTEKNIVKKSGLINKLRPCYIKNHINIVKYDSLVNF